MKIYIASPIRNQEVPALKLEATEPVPSMLPNLESATWTDAFRTFYAEQAKVIADALFASLPGGTVDALLVEFLDRKRSLLRVIP